MINGVIFMAGLSALMGASSAQAQSARDLGGPPPVLPLPPGREPAPSIVVDPPVPSALDGGLVVIQYHVLNLHIVPVFGPDALRASPRIGHIHVTVDGAHWHWADASGEPLIIQSLPPGPHKVVIDLVDANHKLFERRVVDFVIPEKAAPAAHG